MCKVGKMILKVFAILAAIAGVVAAVYYWNLDRTCWTGSIKRQSGSSRCVPGAKIWRITRTWTWRPEICKTIIKNIREFLLTDVFYWLYRNYLPMFI